VLDFLISAELNILSLEILFTAVWLKNLFAFKNSFSLSYILDLFKYIE